MPVLSVEIPVIETERLVLREPREDDMPASTAVVRSAGSAASRESDIDICAALPSKSRPQPITIRLSAEKSAALSGK